MKKQANKERKKQRIREHHNRINGVYFDCHDCQRRWKVDICPKCGAKLKGAYCKVDRAYIKINGNITNCTLPLLGEDGDV